MTKLPDPPAQISKAGLNGLYLTALFPSVEFKARHLLQTTDREFKQLSAG